MKRYPDKTVPFVGGEVESPVVVVVDQLHLVVEPHLHHHHHGDDAFYALDDDG